MGEASQLETPTFVKVLRRVVLTGPLSLSRPPRDHWGFLLRGNVLFSLNSVTLRGFPALVRPTSYDLKFLQMSSHPPCRAATDK